MPRGPKGHQVSGRFTCICDRCLRFYLFWFFTSRWIHRLSWRFPGRRADTVLPLPLATIEVVTDHLPPSCYSVRNTFSFKTREVALKRQKAKRQHVLHRFIFMTLNCIFKIGVGVVFWCPTFPYEANCQSDDNRSEFYCVFKCLSRVLF